MQRTRSWTPAVAPALVAGVVLLLGHPERAAVLAALALVIALLVAIGVDVARGVARAAHAVGHGLGVVLGGVAFAVLIVPAWAWTRLMRKNPLRPRSAAPSWPRVPPAEGRPRSLGSPSPLGVASRGLLRQALWVLECVVLVLALNYGVGWAFDRVTGRDGPDSLAVFLDPATGGVSRDPRNDSPAMASSPWRERYFADLQRTTGGYWPFTDFRPEPFASPYLNLDGWTRRSYETPGSTAGRPLVWMLGGSTTFGEGQRDDYTIASRLAHLAEEAGTPITTANFGQRGWTHFQEMILFEQRLELEPEPDLAVFYDGANEISAQALLDEAVPSNTSVLAFAERLAGTTVATRFLQDGVAVAPSDDLWHAYTQRSMIHKVVHALAPTAAGASPAEPDTDEINQGGARPNAVQGTDYLVTPQDGTDAGRVYERGKRITSQVAAEHGVETLFFWQPVAYNGEPQQRAIAELSPSTIDISRALDDHPEVYIDGAHTNEEGARLVADAIWKHLGPQVRAWYQAHG